MTSADHHGPPGFGSAMRDPEVARQRRLEREALEVQAAERRRAETHRLTAMSLIASGALCLALGIWFLVISPSAAQVDGAPIANIQRLDLGQTASIVGAIFLTGGLLLRVR